MQLKDEQKKSYIMKLFTNLFNHEDIKEIIFRGYEDDEREKFLNELSNRYEKEN